jgi:hypothetical protein
MCSRPECRLSLELAHSMVAGAGGLIQDEGSMLEKTRQREANDMWAI